MPTQLGVVPQYPPRQVDEINTASAGNAVGPPQKISNADPPEEGRLVRVGNMLQIVPERYQIYSIYYIDFKNYNFNFDFGTPSTATLTFNNFGH